MLGAQAETLWLRGLVLSALVAGMSGCWQPPTGAPCSSSADCCAEGPSHLCDTSYSVCVANQFCAADPRCFGSRFGLCGGTGERCGDGVCSPSEGCSACPADCGGCGGCGDSLCLGTESCSSCEIDCGTCPTADCSASDATWSGSVPCFPIAGTPQFVVDRLMSLWNAGPTTICAYDPRAGGSSPCGPLVPNNAVFCPVDVSIQWDMLFMEQQAFTHGDFAPVAIVAHEWGHFNQHRLGVVNGTRLPIQNELHADCQAGVFAAVEESAGLLSMGDVMEAFSSLCSASDPSGWFDPRGHGDCPTRVSAFRWGYEHGRSRLGELCSSGGSADRAMLEICAN